MYVMRDLGRVTMMLKRERGVQVARDAPIELKRTKHVGVHLAPHHDHLHG